MKKLDFLKLVEIYEKIKSSSEEFVTTIGMREITGSCSDDYNRNMMQQLIDSKLARKRKCILYAIELL